MEYIHPLHFVKRSYESLVYIPIRELEPIKIYNADTYSFDRWLKSLLSKHGYFQWEFEPSFHEIQTFTEPTIVWKMKDGSNPFENINNSLTVD